MFKDKHGGKGIGRTNLFQGEMMECYMCGKKKKSEPKIESGWSAIEVIGDSKTGKQIVYFCPDCWKKAMAEFP